MFARLFSPAKAPAPFTWRTVASDELELVGHDLTITHSRLSGRVLVRRRGRTLSSHPDIATAKASAEARAIVPDRGWLC